MKFIFNLIILKKEWLTIMLLIIAVIFIISFTVYLVEKEFSGSQKNKKEI